MTLSDAVPTPAAETPRPRRRAAAVAGVVGVAAVIGGGAWAWRVWSAQGPQPAVALPASTLAYVGLDLDPPGGQKVAAYEALSKFPSLRKELGLAGQDDLSRSVLETVTSESGCDIDIDAVTDWVGDRAALAVVPLDEPELVAAVQVDDPDGAQAGLEEFAAECGDEFGFALTDGWVVLAESTKIAEQVRDDAERSPLAEDADFLELTGAAGDPGVVTAFVAPEAGRALLEAIESEPFLLFFAVMPFGGFDPVTSLVTSVTFLSDLSGAEFEVEDQVEHEAGPDSGGPDGEKTEEDWEPQVPDDLRTALEEFSGLGGIARFDDGTLEVELVTDPVLSGAEGLYDGTGTLEALDALPADSALAFGASLADGWPDRALTEADPLSAIWSEEGATVLERFEEATGLTPADLEALGGDALAFVARDGFEKTIEAEDVSAISIAARITGDADRIEAALEKLRDTEEVVDVLQSRRTDDGVVVGPSPSYLDELVDPGETLGDAERFEQMVPGAEDALSVTWADFDAGDWVGMLTSGDVDEEDAKVLDRAGLTVSEDGDQHRFRLRVTFD